MREHKHTYIYTHTEQPTQPTHTLSFRVLWFKQLDSMCLQCSQYSQTLSLYFYLLAFGFSWWELEKKVVCLRLPNSLEILSKEANQVKRITIKNKICIFRVWLLRNNNVLVMQIKPSAEVKRFAYLGEICHFMHQ